VLVGKEEEEEEEEEERDDEKEEEERDDEEDEGCFKDRRLRLVGALLLLFPLLPLGLGCVEGREGGRESGSDRRRLGSWMLVWRTVCVTTPRRTGCTSL